MSFRVLISNDDGIDAPGIKALYSEVKKVADPIVVGPTTERSAVGHGISVFNDMALVEKRKNGKVWGYGLEGTPADCVKFAITHILKEVPDLVLSGINRGQNAGNNIIYSGTVAAALEGTMFGIPSIALSLAVSRDDKEMHFADAAHYSARLAKMVHRKGLPEGILLNVNFPNVPENQYQGIAVTRQGKSMFEDFFEHKGIVNGLPSFRNIGGKIRRTPHEGDFDDIVLEQNKISITPLHYDLTHHKLRMELDKWVREDVTEELFQIREEMEPENDQG
mgnify:FL=1